MSMYSPSCNSGCLSASLLHRPAVRPTIWELLGGHVWWLLRHTAPAHSGYPGECGCCLGLWDWQVCTVHIKSYTEWQQSVVFSTLIQNPKLSIQIQWKKQYLTQYSEWVEHEKLLWNNTPKLYFYLLSPVEHNCQSQQSLNWVALCFFTSCGGIPSPSLLPRFFEDLKDMLGFTPFRFYYYMWKYVTPLLLILLLGSSVIQLGMTPPSYSAWLEDMVRCLWSLVQLSNTVF